MSDSTIPTPDSAGIVNALSPSPEATKLTDSQKARMDAIERGINEFFDAEVPFMVVASPDVPSAKMRFVHSSRLGYGRELAGVAGQTAQCRSQMLGIALRYLSVGLNGRIKLEDKEGTALFTFESGETKVGGVGPQVVA